MLEACVCMVIAARLGISWLQCRAMLPRRTPQPKQDALQRSNYTWANSIWQHRAAWKSAFFSPPFRPAPSILLFTVDFLHLTKDWWAGMAYYQLFWKEITGRMPTLHNMLIFCMQRTWLTTFVKICSSTQNTAQNTVSHNAMHSTWPSIFSLINEPEDQVLCIFIYCYFFDYYLIGIPKFNTYLQTKQNKNGIRITAKLWVFILYVYIILAISHEQVCVFSKYQIDYKCDIGFVQQFNRQDFHVKHHKVKTVSFSSLKCFFPK